VVVLVLADHLEPDDQGAEAEDDQQDRESGSGSGQAGESVQPDRHAHGQQETLTR